MSKPGQYPEALNHVIAGFSRLPGIGRRTAERLTLAVMNWPPEQLADFGAALAELHQKVHPCAVCGNLTDQQTCAICQDESRQQDLICVVEQASQVAVLETSSCFHGLYHVLGGKLSPLNGKGPADLRLAELQQRLRQKPVAELIIATSPDVEGEATAHFIADMLADLPVTISRTAAGVPVGSDLNFADAATLAMAINGRRKLD
ncbi:MAG: recombination mediator RecR [Lentisphaeria bacterium]|nr:recombination mediator RecR [Lentisphaeria bacterium]